MEPSLTPPLTAAHLSALDALALAIYSASYHGEQVPDPEQVMLELVQNGWMIVPMANASSTGNPPFGTALPTPIDRNGLRGGRRRK